jgi:ATP-dependent Lon protease
VPVDLSSVMFIATANRKDTIPGPLMDRMEMIDISGYTREDKLAIARQFLVPRQLSEHGLTPEQLEISDAAIERLVSEYTHEPGVRQLTQQVAAICRDVAVRVANGDSVHIDADGAFVAKVLGPPKREPVTAEKILLPGYVTTLTWTPAGGDVLLVEAQKMPGRGEVHLTGQMGDLLKEASATALTYIRSRASRFGLQPDVLAGIDVHVHLPKGAMPKEGPALGLPILLSLVSVFTGIKLKPDVAVTGEITLRGKLLRIEGLKPKCLVAHHAGIKQVIIPAANAPDLEEIPEQIRKELTIHLVSNVEDAMRLALATKLPTQRKAVAPSPPA